MTAAARPRRRGLQKAIDGLTFPLRAVTLFEEDRWGLASLASERFDYVAREVRGECLDVGCGRGNRFVTEYLGGRGVGVDVFQYPGLTADQVHADLTKFPFEDGRFASVTMIASINHIPRDLRDIELREAWRVLEAGGNIIVTMGNPFAEIVVHRMLPVYDRVFRTRFDMDVERGMAEGEQFYLLDREIRERLVRVGFGRLRKRHFGTQWGLNHLWVGWKA
jgi:SAM-dependent methyltransferase